MPLHIFTRNSVFLPEDRNSGASEGFRTAKTCIAGIKQNHREVISWDIVISYKGVKFYDAHTIRRFQLDAHAKNWIGSMPDKPTEMDVQTVVTGHINDWPTHFRVRANLTYGSEIIDELGEIQGSSGS